MILSESVVGIDVGLKEFYSDSKGAVVNNPKYLEKNAKKLAREQRRLARKQKGSHNREKQRVKVAAAHEKIANQRNDFLQKQSTMLVRENQTICIEDLKVKGMLRNHKLARAISSVSWSSFFSMLEYKAYWYGCTVIRVPTFYPSSQTCSCCGYKVLFETFKETCSDNVSYKAVVNTMNQEDYLKENIKEVPVFQSIEKQKLVFLEQAQPEDEVEYEIVADVKKMQELVKPIMPKMPVQANRIVVAAEPMRVFGKRYTEVRRVAAEAVKQLPKLHIDYDAGTITFNDENIDLNPNLSEVAKNIKSIQKFFSGMDYFYGDVEQAKKDYFKYMTWYLATPFMAYLRYFASRNNYDTKLFPMYGVIYGDSNGGKTTFIKFLVKLMCGETVKMNTTEDFTATRIDGLKRVCEGLPLNIDDLAKTQFQNHSERVIKNDEWGISDRLVNYPAVSITSNKITSLTKDLSKRAIICRIGAKIDNERGAKNSKRVNESMSELTTAFYGEYVRRMLVCIDEMTTEMRENANGKKNRKAAKIETNNTDTATTVATQKEK